MNMARAMLRDADLLNSFWSDAVLYANYILNRTPSRATEEDLTPHQLFTGNVPDISHLRIFGCKAYVHIPDEKRQKLDSKSLPCVLIESRDVCFDEGTAAPLSHVEIEIVPPTTLEKPVSATTEKKEDHSVSISPGDDDLPALQDVDSDDEDSDDDDYERYHTPTTSPLARVLDRLNSVSTPTAQAKHSTPHIPAPYPHLIPSPDV
ncbi:hypothetical protein NLI96_g12654 [Meripilus lineatus]|uniref:Retroviral polymerase SH3-like domain-containing protein n=1 Tax=Meripilus lineatus TaxID=2056292 RepID=A0AAD5UQU1_9APHY|nr:hypothetical protein NLI96_g12654 [Physisporinus lineatus]